MPQQPSWRHHYIPEFYLKRWMPGGVDRLTQFSKPYGDKVVPQRVYPRETGFVDRRVELAGISPKTAIEAEKQFYSPIVDDMAAAVLNKMEQGILSYDANDRTSWARFVLAFKHRVPEEFIASHRYLVRRLRDVSEKEERKYARVRTAESPATFSEWIENLYATGDLDWAAFTTLVGATEKAEVNEILINMHWGTYSFGWNVPSLLTSDRPLISFGRPKDRNFVIALPVGPKRLFLATQSLSATNRIMTADPWRFRKDLCDFVVSRASRFVYGFSDKELAYVQATMGTQRDPSTMAERIEVDAVAAATLNRGRVATQ